MKVCLEALQRRFASEEHVILAYLFGSQANGTAGPQSDYDIALLVRQPPWPCRPAWPMKSVSSWGRTGWMWSS